MTNIEVEELAAAAPVLKVVAAWRRWKKSHDRNDERQQCCEKSHTLFDALDQLEQEILKL